MSAGLVWEAPFGFGSPVRDLVFAFNGQRGMGGAVWGGIVKSSTRKKRGEGWGESKNSPTRSKTQNAGIVKRG